jgi:hypothetical protein
MSSVEQSWAPPMESQDELNLRLTDSAVPYRSFGALCFAGSASMISAYGSVGVAMADTWQVFGDPSIHVAPVRRSGLVVTVGVSEGAADLDLGSHASRVRFTNLTDHEGDTTRGVSLAVDGSLGLALERLDTDPGWSREGDWAFGRPTGGGGGGGFNPDPTSGYTGTNVWSAGSDIAYNHWTPQGMDISTVADDQPTVWVRWGYQVVVKLRSGAGTGGTSTTPRSTAVRQARGSP